MVAGGAIGAIGAIRLIAQLIGQEQPFRVAVQCFAVLLFAWTGIVGLGLWRANGLFIRWAKVLIAAQVLVFGIGGFAFEFSTGLSARIALSGWLVPIPPPSHSVTIGANLGSSLNMNLTRGDSRWMVGVNLVAVIILACLSRIEPKAASFRSQPPG
jgi:hypothetical protein